jgi:hypothetical protein
MFSKHIASLNLETNPAQSRPVKAKALNNLYDY